MLRGYARGVPLSYRFNYAMPALTLPLTLSLPMLGERGGDALHYALLSLEERKRS